MNECYRILVSRLEIGGIENFILGRSVTFKNAAKKITIEKDDNIYEIITIMIKSGDPTLKLNELVISSKKVCGISNYHKKLTYEKLDRFYYDYSLKEDIPLTYCNMCMFRLLKFSNTAILKIGKK